MDKSNPKLKGALLTFIILQLCYLFFFFITFPDSFRNAIGQHHNLMGAIASWLSTITMLGYCITCLVSVAQLVLRKHVFLLWFQISGAIAIIGNFIVYILRQVSGGIYSDYYYYEGGDGYWVLFILALFWTIGWCMFFARSSRVFTYMGEDASYLRMGLFTKNVRPPIPWQEPHSYAPMYGPPQQPSAWQPPPVAPTAPPPVQQQPQPQPRPAPPPVAYPQAYPAPPVQQPAPSAPPSVYPAAPAPQAPPQQSTYPSPGPYYNNNNPG